uniref:NADH dehydrogenase subunit 5 n=1 Tax=Plaxiphora tricolor TaxID=2045497 RepID=UPI002E7A19A7|nr:NADH dehydrogenase subunit 5 [Plaxiphora tricolor]WRI60250.1 NADH dehydrogenase subunit 5 [Plaxiphora tricolor]
MKFLKTSVGLAFSFLFFVSMVGLVLEFFLLSKGKLYLLEFCLFKVNSCLMSFMIVFDWGSVLFSSLVCFISGCVMIFSKSYMESDPFINRFVWIVMLFVCSMNFLIFIPSMVSLLLGWDGLGLVSFCLVIYYQNYKSLGAGLMTAFMNRVGDVAILLSIGWSFSQGHFNGLFMWDFGFCSMVMLGLMLAGMTKSAQIPFSSWLPAAMAAPTPVSALVHSSTLVTAGVFLLIRFYPFLSKFYFFSFFLNIVSILTMFMAGVAATCETDLKKIIALSTLSQLGVMMFSVSMGFSVLALFHLFTHALFKALLFLCAGSFIHSFSNNQDIRKMSQLWSELPVSSTCFNIANLALCGFPFMAGFYSKDLIIEMMLFNEMNYFSVFLMVTSTMLTAMYSVRTSVYVFWSEFKQNVMSNSGDEEAYMLIPVIMLSVGALCGGSILSWMLIVPLEVPVISSSDKVVGLMVTLVGSFIMYLMLKGFMLKDLNIVSLFLINMWFMSSLSNNFVSVKWMDVSVKMYKYLDLGWAEFLGGEKIFELMKKVSQSNQINQGNYYNFFIGFMLNGILFFLVFLFFW